MGNLGHIQVISDAQDGPKAIFKAREFCYDSDMSDMMPRGTYLQGIGKGMRVLVVIKGF